MRIGILTDYLDYERIGIGNYTLNLVESLLRIDRENEYFLIHQKKSDMPIYGEANEIILPRFPVPPRSIIRKNCILPSILAKNKIDVIHDPTNAGPFFFSFPTKRILTIHDLAPLIIPNAYNKRLALYYRYVLPFMIKTADRVIAVSKNTKNDLVNRLHVNENKIKVIYLGVNQEYKPLQKTEEITKKYGLTESFILFVGNIAPRKNLLVLLQAFNKLKKRKIKHKLVIAGKKDQKHKQVLKMVNDLNLGGEVIFTGYIPEEDLPSLYNAADLFVYPSLYEGFGLPVLESMACGTPVVASNTSSLPEVVGDAGLLINPRDVDALTDAIYKVLTDDELKESLVEKGLRRVKLFAWEKTARETLRVYKEVVG